MSIVAFVVLALCAQPANQGEPEEARAAREIFDGRSLDGWRGDPRWWRVEDGVIVGESASERPLDATTYLVWEGGDVADFELALQFRIQGGNSGVQFRSRLVGPLAVAGYQADMEDGPSWTGGLYEQDGRGVVARRGEQVILRPGGAEVTVLDDSELLLAAIRAWDWNEYRIRAVGERIDLWVNGLHTCRVIDEDPAHRVQRGLLALQLHAGPPMKVEYREVRLTELTEAAPAPDEPPGKSEYSPGVRWIWPTRAIEDHQEAWLRKRFLLEGKAVSATLRGACDNRTNVYLNGELVAASAAWWSPYEQDDNVVVALREGENVFAAWGQNETMTAGFWLELTVETADGTRTSIVTDESWSAAREEADDFEAPDFDDSRWPRAVVLGELGGPPWGDPSNPTPFEPSEALPAEELELARGFRAELLYTVPRVRQGSWVCLTSDERGRLYASDQYGALYRIVPPPPGQSAGTSVERIEIELGEAQGLAWANGALYVVVNGHGHHESGLWRASDRDGDDRLDTVELLAPIDGSGEHGPHAVRVAPDGASLYVMAGNFTELPEHMVKSRVTPAWGEDLLLPRLDDPNGHDVGILAPGAWLCRTDFEGQEWELVASGLRNPYDFDFDPSGEAFTFDSDMEWDTGLPWYRPTRIVHVVSGAEFGWRNGSGKWPPHYPDNLPAVVDIGLSSPTGVEFGTHARFPERWRRALYACDWAYGTLYAVHLEPDGASFTGSFEVFARGKPFPITDACVAPDGAMYVTTGGRQTQSALYRITAVEPEEPEGASAIVEAAEVRAARAARRELEAAHGRVQPEIVPVALARLGDPDRFVRWAARVALEHQAVETWADAAVALAEPRARVEAIVALARVGPASSCERLIACFQALPFDEMTAADVASALRALELVLIRMGSPSEPLALVARLDGMYPSGDSRVDRGLCQLLVWLQAGGEGNVIEKTLDRIESGASQEDRLHYAACLRLVEDGWTKQSRRHYFAFLDDASMGFAGGHSFTLFLDRIREDAMERVPPQARREFEGMSEVFRLVHAALRLRRSADVEASMAPEAKTWNAGELRVLLTNPLHGRSFESGRTVYEKATCAQCHRMRGEGGSTGPDLTGAGSRFSRLDLLDAILEPSRVIPDQYEDQELVTADDELLVGRIEREEGGTLHLRLLPPAEELVAIDTARIVERRAHPLSRMPAGLLDALSEAEIADLFAYVLSGGDAGDRAFQREDR